MLWCVKPVPQAPAARAMSGCHHEARPRACGRQGDRAAKPYSLGGGHKHKSRSSPPPTPLPPPCCLLLQLASKLQPCIIFIGEQRQELVALDPAWQQLGLCRCPSACICMCTFRALVHAGPAIPTCRQAFPRALPSTLKHPRLPRSFPCSLQMRWTPCWASAG